MSIADPEEIGTEGSEMADQNTSHPEAGSMVMSEEVQQMVAMFKLLKAKTNMESPQDLAQLMTDYVTSPPAVKPEPSPEASTLPAASGTSFPPASPMMQPMVVGNFPRLPVFTGAGKGDTSYDLWKYEVQCIRADHHSQSTIREALRRSLRGEAGNVAMRLGPNADVEQILHKMDSVYGTVTPDERLLSEFFSAQQKTGEDVASWGCRLEDLLSKVDQQGFLDQVGYIAKERMLMSAFWSGLGQPLKDISGYLYEQATDFDQLRVRIRQLEQEHRATKAEKPATKPVPAKAAVDNKEMAELKAMVKQLASDVNSMKGNDRDRPPPHPRADNFRRLTPASYNPPPQRSQYQHQQQYQQQPSFGQQQPGFNQQQSSFSHQQPLAQGGEGAEGDDTVCWRCGQLGHIQLGCRVRLDHRRRGLNSNRPASRGGR